MTMWIRLFRFFLVDLWEGSAPTLLRCCLPVSRDFDGWLVWSPLLIGDLEVGVVSSFPPWLVNGVIPCRSL